MTGDRLLYGTQRPDVPASGAVRCSENLYVRLDARVPGCLWLNVVRGARTDVRRCACRRLLAGVCSGVTVPDVRLGELEVPLRMADDLLGGAHRGRVPAGPPPAVSPPPPPPPLFGTRPPGKFKRPEKMWGLRG